MSEMQQSHLRNPLVSEAASTLKPLRHVLIGAGAGIFKTHQEALTIDTAELVAVADQNPKIGPRLEEELGIPFYRDHRQMLADLQPDVAVIVTPHPFHAPLAIDALRAGAHVLVEKPISVHVGEADAMIQAADEADRLLAVNFQLRLSPQALAARKLIDEGALGEIQHVEMAATWMRTRRYFRNAGWRGTWKGEGGGVLMNQAPHNLDLLCHLAGMPSRVVSWNRTALHEIETEDTVQAMLEWPNGALGSLHVSTAESGKPFYFEIIGTKGILKWDEDGLMVKKFAQDVRIHIAESELLYQGPQEEIAPVTLPSSAGDHTAIYRNLHNAILHGSPLSADGREARMSIELANAMIYSSYTRNQVLLPLDREKYVALLEDLRSGIGTREDDRH